MTDLKELLGLTQEELQARVVNVIVDRLLTSAVVDDEDNVWPRPSDLQNELQTLVKEELRKKVAEKFEKHAAPLIQAKVVDLVVNRTTRFGEPAGKRYSFTELLVHLTKQYLTEKVSPEPGKTSKYPAKQPKISRIEQLIKQALGDQVAVLGQELLTSLSQAMAQEIGQSIEERMQGMSHRLLEAIRKGAT